MVEVDRHEQVAKVEAPMCSGRLCPLTRPSFAAWVWITIAARFAATTTHTSS
jgi:hypothetical protein